MRVLLVEDDPILGDGLSMGLQQSGYTVDWLTDGQAADHALCCEDFDLVVLDLGLPKLDGVQVLRRLRARGAAVPVLVLTARDAVPERVRTLDLGADDYLIKPFDLDELTARLRALRRRFAGRATPKLRCGDLEFDPVTRSVHLNGHPTPLSARELALLQTLLENRGRILSRERLEQSLYGWSEEIESNAVEVHIHHLRRKLGKDLIKTVRGVGYTIPNAQGGGPAPSCRR